MTAKITRVDKSKSWEDQDLGGSRKEQGRKALCIVRYGGFGDMLQVAAMFPIFKKLGYYICMNTRPSGYEIIKHDPNVDEFLIQDVDFVAGPELGPYWFKINTLFDKFVNYSESIEASLLALEGRSPIYWDRKARHRYMNHNYFEFMADIAGIPYDGENPIFYPSKKEDKWAKEERSKIGGKKAKVVVWAMSGSSWHKVTPFVDMVIARILQHHPEVHFVLTGDEACKILVGTSWKNEKRVHNWAGADIRNTLAFLPYADAVVGPETGVTNLSGGLDVPTVLFLGHSSVENVSKHWKKTISLEPDCKCHPCHILHSTNQYCNIVDLRDYAETMIKPEWDEKVYADIREKPIPIAMCSLVITDDMIHDALIMALYRSNEI